MSVLVRRFAVALLAAMVGLASACGGRSAARGSAGAFVPPANAALPRDPGALAASLTRGTRALDGSIDFWLAHGDTARGAPPRALVLQALYQQRIYRLLAPRPRLAAATLRRLPARLRPAARDITTALRDLMRLAPRKPPPPFKTAAPAPAGRLLGYYRTGQHRFRVAWNVLASVNFVESDFGRVRSSSVAGAQGPMQFVPSTWRVYGMGGNIRDPHDAILGAANYLHRSGAPGNYHRALFAYNPSSLYVDAVLRYAYRMAHDRHAYYAFYSWQVFERTRSGEKRLTGP